MSRIFLAVLNMSFTAGYCVIAVIVLRFLLKRQPKIFSYLLWSVVLFRLLCPFSLTSSYSLLRVNTTLFSGERIRALDMADAGAEEQNAPDGAVFQEAGGIAENTLTEQNGNPAAAARIWVQRAVGFASWVWFAGVAALLFYSVRRVIRLRRLLSGAVRTEKGFYETEEIETPFVLGIWRPQIYLPAHLREEERGYVLAHERVHIARKDYFVKILFYAAACVHWFNPLVWLAFALMETDMEMSCDEAVLGKLGMEVKKQYCETLLLLSSGKTKLRGAPPAFGEGNIKGRVRNVLAYRKKTVWAVILTASLLLAIGAGLALNPARQEMNEEEAQRLNAFVEAYAEAFSSRDGETAAAFYADEETALENVFMLEKTDGIYTLGMSSPWPLFFRYHIVPEENRADIYYYAWTSDPHVSVWKEEIRYTAAGEEYRISESSMRMLDSISTKEAFDAAYRIQDNYQFVDYQENGFVEAIQFQREEGTSTVDNTVYLEPVKAAEHILNLEGGTGSMEGGSDYQVMVRYTFGDGSEVLIPMFQAAYDVETGASKGTPVWIVDTAVWNAGAP